MSDLWSVTTADALEWFAGLPADCASLVFGSPPYEKARTYGIDFALEAQAWVDWMVSIYQAARRVCTGVVAFVLEGQTRNYRWSAVPALLMADLHRAGFHLRKPPIFQRIGIPGSGGPDWLRNDYEFIVATTRGGKLHWSDNTAMGHTPKWAPGGEMSYRCQDGSRRNEWGSTGHPSSGEGRRSDGAYKTRRNKGPFGNLPSSSGREQDGRPKKRFGRNMANGSAGVRVRTGPDDGEVQEYVPPVLANPGNVIRCKVGGGRMGNRLCHENEAPFPERLAEFWVRSFAPPGGLVLDCFSGSGTTGAVAVRWGRRFQGCDVRAAQVEISRRRIAGETPMLFEGSADA